MLASWNDGVVFVGTTPRVRTAAVFVIRWNAAVANLVSVKQLDIAAYFDAIFVLGNWFVLVKFFGADTFVTFKILRLHAVTFMVSLSFELACRELFGFFFYGRKKINSNLHSTEIKIRNLPQTVPIEQH